jgi:hypothetical protein
MEYDDACGKGSEEDGGRMKEVYLFTSLGEVLSQ